MQKTLTSVWGFAGPPVMRAPASAPLMVMVRAEPAAVNAPAVCWPHDVKPENVAQSALLVHATGGSRKWFVPLFRRKPQNTFTWSGRLAAVFTMVPESRDFGVLRHAARRPDRGSWVVLRASPMASRCARRTPLLWWRPSHEGRHSSAVRQGQDRLCLRQCHRDPFHRAPDPRRDLLGVPSVLHGQAEARRYRRPGRALPA